MLNRYAYKSITSEEFKESFKQDVQNSLIPLDLFFDQWLFKAGHPQLRYIFTSERINQDEYSVKVELSQVQKGNNVPDVFTIPVTFYFFGPNRSVINESVINNQREQTFTFTIPFMPDSIKIDSLQVLLEVKYNLGTVSELSKPDEGNSGIAYPNPSRTGQVVNLEYRITGNDKFFLDLIDNLGKNIKNIYTGRLSEGNYKFSFDTDGINPGVYYIILKSANKFLSKKLVIF
jgi:hypothetical protein